MHQTYKRCFLVGGFMSVFLLLFSPEALLSQSSAADWLKIGLKSQAIDEKIQAFENAIQIDPNYIEAYYFLGLAYKTKGKLPEAEIALNNAYFKSPYSLSNEAKARILYELGTIYFSREKIAEAKDAFRGAKSLSVDKTIKSRICYELGRIYVQEGNYDAALNELNEGINLLPQSAEMFEEAIKLAEENKSLNDKYNTAISLLSSERYAEAIKLLDDVLRMDANFELAQQKLYEAKNALKQKNRSKRLNALYEQAAIKLKKGSVNEAIVLLKQIRNIEPNYRDTSNLIQQAEAALENRRVKQRKQNVEKEQEEPADNGKVTKKSKPPAEAIANNMQAVKKVLDDSTEQDTKIEEIYQDGVLALQNGDWQQAVLAFEKVNLLNPEYKDVQIKIADARFNLTKSNLSQIQTDDVKTEGSRALTIIGFAVSALGLPLFGILIFSPMTRARVSFKLGKYDKDANKYERLLRKNPGRVKLYPVLANIYLLKNRRDEMALKVFEMILRMDLNTKNKEEINSIMANHYITNGRIDATAIQIMERELDAKTKKLNSNYNVGLKPEE
jgi:tetratricopeptide (TPR) repeat protein